MRRTVDLTVLQLLAPSRAWIAVVGSRSESGDVVPDCDFSQNQKWCAPGGGGVGDGEVGGGFAGGSDCVRRWDEELMADVQPVWNASRAS